MLGETAASIPWENCHAGLPCRLIPQPSPPWKWGPESAGLAQPCTAYRVGPAPSRPAKTRQGQALLRAGRAPPSPCTPYPAAPPSLMLSPARVLSLHWQGYVSPR